jgi:predicted TIM-barrel fold metal-dependent hydrolase
MLKFIDIHAHAYRRPVPFVVQFCSPAELKVRYAAEGVQMGALLPIVSPEIYLPQSNEDILEMAAEAPETFFPFCNVDPRALTNRADAPLDTVLAYYRDLGCRGVGEIMPNLRMDDPRVQNLFRCAEAVGLPVTCDGSDRAEGDFGLYDLPGVPLLEHTLQRFPRLKFIAHGPIFWSEVRRLQRPAMRKTEFRPDGTQVGFLGKFGKVAEEGVAQQLLRTYDNLYGELSDALVFLEDDPEYAAAFLTEFQDKLFYGSDTCCATQPFRLKAFLVKLHDDGLLADGPFAKIVRLNAIRFFQLPIAP